MADTTHTFSAMTASLRQQARTPRETREKWLNEELAYYKQELQTAIIEKNKKGAEDLVQKLIDLRAKQVALSIENGQPLLHAAKMYYTESISLLQAVDAEFATP